MLHSYQDVRWIKDCMGSYPVTLLVGAINSNSIKFARHGPRFSVASDPEGCRLATAANSAGPIALGSGRNLTGDARPRFFESYFALLEERGDAREAMTVGYQPTSRNNARGSKFGSTGAARIAPT